MNVLLDRLGIRLPIVQAPMAGISPPEMAAAVSNAGGLGSIGVGNVDVKTARAMIAATRARTDRPFNVNLFCHPPAARNAAVEAAWVRRLAPLFAKYNAQAPTQLHEIYKSFVEDYEMAEMLIAERPAVVSFHFGLPGEGTMRALQKQGVLLLATATNLDECRRFKWLASMWLWRKAMRRAVIAGISIRRLRMSD